MKSPRCGMPDIQSEAASRIKRFTDKGYISKYINKINVQNQSTFNILDELWNKKEIKFQLVNTSSDLEAEGTR